MNLREIGILLASIYALTIFLISYKYYKAKGGVFKVSRLLFFKYVLRFLSLVIILVLCYNTVLTKQIAFKLDNNKPRYLVTISSINSGLTWNKIRDKIIEMPPNGEYGLILFNTSSSHWEQIIPATNQDSFLNLIEHAQDAPIKLTKKIFPNRITYKAEDDQFSILQGTGNQWNLEEDRTKEDSFLSKNAFIGWIQASYVPLYLVILLLFFSFIDIVFPIKALRI